MSHYNKSWAQSNFKPQWCFELNLCTNRWKLTWLWCSPVAASTPWTGGLDWAWALDWGWVDDVHNLDSIWIPDTILLQAALHHPTVGWHPSGVVAEVMPGLLMRVVLTIDGDHFPHADQNLDDGPVRLRVIDGIAAGFLQVSAEVDAAAEHPACRLTKTWFLDGFSVLLGGAMVHDVLSTTNRFILTEFSYSNRRIEVIFSPRLLLVHVGLSVAVGERFRVKSWFKEATLNTLEQEVHFFGSTSSCTHSPPEFKL